MRIVLVSGFLNKHLLPLCLELKKKNDFIFVATQNFVTDTSRPSYNREALDYDFVMKYYLDSEQEKIRNLVLDCDVAIFGGSSLDLLEYRKKSGKLSFIYTERLFKRGQWRRFIPSTKNINNRKFITDNDNLYVLCASSYVKSDVKLIGFPVERCFKFGYFPEMEKRAPETFGEIKDNNPIKLLYVGRLLKLKRVSDVLKCCARLQKNGIKFQLVVIGDGPERKNLEKLSVKMAFGERVTFVGAKPPQEVNEYMYKSNILFFSSNYYEGWGTVVNEALGNGCAVIGSDACGSIAYLIKNGVNGVVYKMGDINDLYDKTASFMQSADFSKVSLNSYRSINEEWNAMVAAERFCSIAQKLISGEQYPRYTDGPMSKA